LILVKGGTQHLGLADRSGQRYQTGMQGLRRQMQRFAPLLLLLALLGAGGRLAAPAGFMPEFGPDGAQLILCSGHSIALPTQDGHLAPHDASDDICPYAAAAMGADAPLATTSILPIRAVWTMPAAPLPGAATVGAGIGERARPATGPPRTA
jgi:hypothetical protein